MTSDKTTLSLNDACVSLLGSNVDKTLQTSNWSHRPLTRQQIEYAAPGPPSSQLLSLLYEQVLSHLAARGGGSGKRVRGDGRAAAAGALA